MVFLRRIERTGRHDFGCDPLAETSPRPSRRLVRHPELSVVMRECRRATLISDVPALPVDLRRVVDVRCERRLFVTMASFLSSRRRCRCRRLQSFVC